MIITKDSVSAPLPDTHIPSTTTERWLQAAKADFPLCQDFSRQYDAQLPRSLRSQRVGWEAYGHPHFALLLPDSTRIDCLTDDEWYMYYVAGERFFRHTRTERERAGMTLLAESVDDWAELLRQALREEIFDVRYTVTPDYVNALGDTETVISGFVFVLESSVPQAAGTAPCRITGAGTTPEEAARAACRSWLQHPRNASGSLGKSA